MRVHLCIRLCSVTFPLCCGVVIILFSFSFSFHFFVELSFAWCGGDASKHSFQFFKHSEWTTTRFSKCSFQCATQQFVRMENISHLLHNPFTHAGCIVRSNQMAWTWNGTVARHSNANAIATATAGSAWASHLIRIRNRIRIRNVGSAQCTVVSCFFLYTF